MKLILHDIKDKASGELKRPDNDTVVFSACPKVKHCTACLGCFFKTPGLCVIDDRAKGFLKYLGQADEIIIISEMRYGGFSSEIKAVQDRFLGYLLPFFRMKDGRMNHPPRFGKNISLRYHIYSGETAEMTSAEIDTMRGIAEANARNLSAAKVTCTFYNSIDELKKSEVYHENLTD